MPPRPQRAAGRSVISRTGNTGNRLPRSSRYARQFPGHPAASFLHDGLDGGEAGAQISIVFRPEFYPVAMIVMTRAISDTFSAGLTPGLGDSGIGGDRVMDMPLLAATAGLIAALTGACVLPVCADSAEDRGDGRAIVVIPGYVRTPRSRPRTWAFLGIAALLGLAFVGWPRPRFRCSMPAPCATWRWRSRVARPP